jgi:hypothetical protein
MDHVKREAENLHREVGERRVDSRLEIFFFFLNLEHNKIGKIIGSTKYRDNYMSFPRDVAVLLYIYVL